MILALLVTTAMEVFRTTRFVRMVYKTHNRVQRVTTVRRVPVSILSTRARMERLTM